jgi:hypothetical protein
VGRTTHPTAHVLSLAPWLDSLHCQHASTTPPLPLGSTAVCNVHVAGKYAANRRKAPTCRDARLIKHIKYVAKVVSQALESN